MKRVPELPMGKAQDQPMGLLATVLSPLEWLYCKAMQLRRLLYKKGIFASYRLPGTTISVGNLEVGGTGKTPICIEIARYLLARGYKPAILTRGYRSGLKASEYVVLLDGDVAATNFNGLDFHADEARLQSYHLPEVPILIGRQRWETAQRYLSNHAAPDYWILDDGFQHLKIQRDRDIVLLDSKRPFSNTRCLPTGRLRESPRTLLDADAVIYTRHPAKQQTMPYSWPHQRFNHRLEHDTAQFIMGDAAPADRSSLQHFDPSQPILLLLGIAKPDHVLQFAQKHSWNLQRTELLSDHQPIPAATQNVMRQFQGLVVTTEKDFFRDRSIFTDFLFKVYLIPLQVRMEKGLDCILSDLNQSVVNPP